MDFWQFHNNFKKTKPKLVELAIDAMSEKEILRINRMQLIKGVDSEDKLLNEYAESTLKSKRKRSGFISPSGRIALKDNGNYHKGMYVEKSKEYAKVFTKHRLQDILFDVHGEQLFGLNDSNVGIVLTKSREKYIKKIEKALL